MWCSPSTRAQLRPSWLMARPGRCLQHGCPTMSSCCCNHKVSGHTRGHGECRPWLTAPGQQGQCYALYVWLDQYGTHLLHTLMQQSRRSSVAGCLEPRCGQQLPTTLTGLNIKARLTLAIMVNKPTSTSPPEPHQLSPLLGPWQTSWGHSLLKGAAAVKHPPDSHSSVHRGVGHDLQAAQASLDAACVTGLVLAGSQSACIRWTRLRC